MLKTGLTWTVKLRLAVSRGAAVKEPLRSSGANDSLPYRPNCLPETDQKGKMNCTDNLLLLCQHFPLIQTMLAKGSNFFYSMVFKVSKKKKNNNNN